ncbi:MAG: 2-phosphosulfolactate phosphatase [Actinomycetota bacterium]|nr:2-phosphosulfolactate phosphatase [Actinomycetota bacterium]
MVDEVLVGPLRQQGSGVRFDWGSEAATLLGGDAGAVVVVDVLSFTTSVSIATGRGTEVVPFPMDAEGAAELAARLGATLAVRRREQSPEHPWSLSPAALLAAPPPPRLVLPSPNGSAIAASLGGPAVLAGCLRNLSATVGWLRAHGYGAVDRPVLLVAAGERWPDGSLRPALEDQLGAGAVAGALERAGCKLSVEAQIVAGAFASATDLLAAIEGCASGRELAAMGFPDEARHAAALDADAHASVMEQGAFVSA